MKSNGISKNTKIFENSKSKSIVFIDSNIPEYSSLLKGIKEGVEVIIIDSQIDGVEQITRALQKFAVLHGYVEAVHIFSHGNPGQLHLGSTILSSDNLKQYISQLQQWRNVFKNSSSTAATGIFLYGCDVAFAEGASFVERLSQLTGTNVAASTDKTGSAIRGANWDLEYKTGEIEVPTVLKLETQKAYKGVLGTLTVTNNADSGPGSLRNAIATATPGDTIVFAPSLAGQTITLTSGQILINKNLIIDGAAAPGLTISGNNTSRVFETNIDASFNPTNVTLRNLIIANGKVTGADDIVGAGGAIRTGQQCVLVIENCQINNNFAELGGGGIYGGYRSTTIVINSKFNGNDGTAGKQERGGGAIAARSESIITVQGSEFINNKGINGGAINSLLSQLTVENSKFINNDTTAGISASGGFGGAIYTDGASDNLKPDSGTVLIRNSLFEGNKGTGQGGAAFLYLYTPDKAIVENSTFINNSVIKNTAGVALGGAIRGSVDLTVNNSTFANNIAETQGGAIWLGETTKVNITNSTFSGNKAVDAADQGLGGGIFFANGSAASNIVNSTFVNNYAGSFGGAFGGGGTNVTLKNTIVANNVAGNPFNKNQHTINQFTDGGGNIQWPAKNPADATDVNVTAAITIANPLLGPLQDNGGNILTHALLPGSPAIDAGTSTGAPTTDQRGIPRPQDGDGNGTALVDSGAYELIASVPEIQVLDGSINIIDGTTTAISFGSTTLGTPIIKIFTIQNTGTAALNLSNLSLPTGFSLVGTFPNSIPAGSQANLQVQLDATAVGNSTGILSFITNDSDENPFDFAIAGTVVATTPASCLCDKFPIPNFNIPLPVANSVTNTINGTNSDDTLIGSAAPEAINGLGGNDIVSGRDGNDNILGGEGNDFLYGNPGNDIILGYFGRDTIFGGKDNDALFGGADDDVGAGNLGNDTIFGGKNNDLLYGNVGDELIYGQLGNDTIFGGKDNDALLGGANDDIIAGDIGNDTLLGEDGNDLLYGNVGADFIAGGIGEDTIFGGKDNDILKGGVGNDIVAGNVGNDTVCGGDGNEQLYGNVGTDIMDGCEGDDTLFGG
ncbi:MAG: DUF4347 domain-containing protein, partial [Oscillatoriaceae bacterium SKYG93]|nr:DUF4347 domain-containing protein [Oscillatoriaceae bacterium SKYG93]MDW8453906.1 DUF4347 domain-containing protein [Oscillatoriaceae cyanobacterium SKYGB_i_bin93]